MGPIKHYTRTTGITQHCSRQKYGHCDFRFINQVRPRTNGKVEMIDNTVVLRAVCADTGHGLEMDTESERQVAISLTSIILCLQKPVLPCPVLISSPTIS